MKIIVHHIVYTSYISSQFVRGLPSREPICIHKAPCVKIPWGGNDNNNDIPKYIKITRSVFLWLQSVWAQRGSTKKNTCCLYGNCCPCYVTKGATKPKTRWNTDSIVYFSFMRWFRNIVHTGRLSVFCVRVFGILMRVRGFFVNI